MKTINDYATLYYKENIEGDPLTQDVPIECFIEGSKLAIKFANWNLAFYFLYTLKNMEEKFRIFLNEYYKEYEKEITI